MIKDSVKRDFYTIVQLSKNIYKDNDGTLVCENAVLGKAGTQAYSARELGLDSSEVVLLHRPEEEVFDEQSLASLKGKALTLYHPDEDVNVENYLHHAKGIVQDVRREGNLIIGDIRVYDKEVIDLITSKEMVELSLGYRSKIVPAEDGKLKQTEITYNHVALVPKGRAEVARVIDMFGGEHQIRDKQLDLEEDTLEKDKQGILSSLFAAIGLKKVKDEEGKELYELSKDTEEIEVQDEKVEPEQKENKEDKDVEAEVEVQDEETIETADKTNEQPEEEVKVTDEETQKEPETKTTEENETVVTDEETEEGDELMEFDKLIAKAKEIESLKDEEMKKSLKDALFAELKGKPEEQTDNSALDKFGKPMKVEDDKPSFEMVDFDKEFKQMIKDLDPHRYDSYAEYRKARRRMEEESTIAEMEQDFRTAVEGEIK